MVLQFSRFIRNTLSIQIGMKFIIAFSNEIHNNFAMLYLLIYFH